MRATAIVMVLLFHLGGEYPGKDMLWLKPARGWWSGVDLFFVLSGFLIGGLYWRELATRGSVDIPRFLQRRWLRTIPPYLIALLVTYTGKRLIVDHGLHFDPAYLVFLQNYTGIKYFGVSWSLCIEEHFYLVLPFALLLARRGGRAIHLMFAAALVAPWIGRLLDTSAHGGYPTHLHCEGLVAGVWLAYLATFEPAVWRALSRAATWLAVPALSVVLVLSLLQQNRSFARFHAFMALAGCFSVLLAAVVNRPALRVAVHPLVGFMARTSYSLYLTHYLVIEAYPRLVLRRLPQLSSYVHLSIEVAMILALGYTFHRFVEATSVRLRDRVAPRPTEGRPQQSVLASGQD